METSTEQYSCRAKRKQLLKEAKKDNETNKIISKWMKKIGPKINNSDGRYTLLIYPPRGATESKFDNMPYVGFGLNNDSLYDYLQLDRDDVPLLASADSKEELLPETEVHEGILRKKGVRFEIFDRHERDLLASKIDNVANTFKILEHSFKQMIKECSTYGDLVEKVVTKSDATLKNLTKFKGELDSLLRDATKAWQEQKRYQDTDE